MLRLRVEAALAYVAKVALGPKREEVSAPRPSESGRRSARRYQTRNRRDPRFSRPPELGPIDAYVLDGGRYIRVEGEESYALVDTRTGKVPGSRRQANTLLMCQTLPGTRGHPSLEVSFKRSYIPHGTQNTFLQ